MENKPYKEEQDFYTEWRISHSAKALRSRLEFLERKNAEQIDMTGSANPYLVAEENGLRTALYLLDTTKSLLVALHEEDVERGVFDPEAKKPLHTASEIFENAEKFRKMMVGRADHLNAGLSKEELSERNRKAVAARWEKYREAGSPKQSLEERRAYQAKWARENRAKKKAEREKED